jgi:hypothetical protein
MLQTVEDDASRWGFRMAAHTTANAAGDLLGFAAERRFRTILADPPWQFTNKTGKVAPEHRRLTRYSTMSLEQIKSLPVEAVAVEPAHLYLWVPNALLPDGLSVMAAWGFQYRSNVVWHKVRRRAREERQDASAGSPTGEHDRDSEARALTQAGRAIRGHRVLLPWPVPGTVRAWDAPRLGNVGKSGGRRTRANLGHICISFPGDKASQWRRARGLNRTSAI